MTRKTFVDGDRWMAADAQMVMDQGFLIFADNAERDAEWPTPAIGSHCYVLDTGTPQVRTANGWRNQTQGFAVNGSDTSAQTPGRWFPIARAVITTQYGIARAIIAVAHHGGSGVGSSTGILSLRVQQQSMPPTAPNIDLKWLSRSVDMPIESAALVVDHGSLPTTATLYVKTSRTYETAYAQAMLNIGFTMLDRQPLEPAGSGSGLPSGTQVMASDESAVGGSRVKATVQSVPGAMVATKVLSFDQTPRPSFGVSWSPYGGSEFRANATGFYLITASARFVNAAAGERCWMGVWSGSGATPVGQTASYLATEGNNGQPSAQNVYLNGSWLIPMAVDQTVALAVSHSGTAAINVDQVLFAIARIGG